MTDSRYVFPLSSAQRRLWLLQQVEPESAAYHLAVAVELRGDLEIRSFERALEVVTARHETLRTCFVERDGAPVQVVAERLEIPLRLTLLDGPEPQDARLQERLAVEVKQPFDLTRAPCLRARLFRLAPTRHVLLLVLHHLIADGWSLGVLVKELTIAYTAYRNRTQPSLRPLTIQYGDFAEWQQEASAAEAQAADVQYWSRQLAGPVPPLELPADRVRPPVERYRGDRLTFALDPGVTEGVRTMARGTGTTPFMVILAAFQVLLSRYSGQTDFCVGTPVAGRSRPELEPLIGFFVNTLPLRADLSGDPTFREVLRRVRESLLAGLAHQDLPFDRIVEVLRVVRDASRNPLFQVMLAFQPPSLEPIPLPGLEVRPIELVRGTAQFDLTLFLQERSDGISAWVEYSTDLFDATTVGRMMGHFRRLLQVCVAGPDRAIGEVELIGESERAQLAEWNATAAPYPDECVHRLVEAQAQSAPDAVAVQCGADCLTYADLDTRASALANRLQGEGARPGDRVGVCMERSVLLPVAILGVAKSGAAYLPLDPAYPHERLTFMLEDSGARLVVMDESTRARVALPEGVRVVDVGIDTSAGTPARTVPVSDGNPDDLAYIIYTSGTTGRPKGVEVTHRALGNFLTSMQREPGLCPSDILVAVTTLSFDIAGLELWLPLITGARVVVAPRETAMDGGALGRLLEEAGATIMQATPVTWRLLLESGWAGKPDLRILSGGEALPRDLADRLLDHGCVVWNLYGPTETTVWSALWKVERGGPVLIGHPIANTQLHVFDKRGRPVPIGVVGELYIGGTGVARGYRGRPELTAERFVPDPGSQQPGARMYRTGDLARWRANGALECLGRIDQQLKLHGYRIEPGEIEQALRSHPGVSDAAVVVVEHAQGDRRLVAYVVTTEPSSTPDALRAHLMRALPSYMIPGDYVELPDLPRTPNGKVDRRALPAPTRAPEPWYQPPEGETERELARMWADVLRVERVGRQDDFFALGGHSLLAAQITSRLRTRFAVDVRVRLFFEAPTLACFAEKMDALLWKAAREDAGPSIATEREEFEL
jgi:amino acid adenylation domain-containing protein